LIAGAFPLLTDQIATFRASQVEEDCESVEIEIPWLQLAIRGSCVVAQQLGSVDVVAVSAVDVVVNLSFLSSINKRCVRATFRIHSWIGPVGSASSDGFLARADHRYQIIRQSRINLARVEHFPVAQVDGQTPKFLLLIPAEQLVVEIPYVVR